MRFSFTDFFVSFPIAINRVTLGKMSKLNALKEKLAGVKAQLIEKTDKIAFIRKWREGTKPAPAGDGQKKRSYSLSSIYRDGSTGTRLQVIAFYVLIIVGIFSSASMLKKVGAKFTGSKANDQLKQEYSHEFAEARRKSLESIEMLSLGQFTSNVYVGPPKDSMKMNIDLWVRVSNADAAASINNDGSIYQDRTAGVLADLFAQKVNLLTEEGKNTAREEIKEALNSALKSGKVEEVFIQNLTAQ